MSDPSIAEPSLASRNEPRPLQRQPTDFEIEGPFVHKVNVAALVFWFVALVLSAGAFLACVFFTAGALLRANGIL